MNIPNQKKGSERKKPKFVRQQFFKHKLKSKWRRPKGLHSKLRLQKKGHGKKIKVGYGSPKVGRDLLLGFKPIIVCNIKDLEKIDSKTQAILISRGVGTKKKVELLKKIKDLKIKVLNVKNIDAFLKKVEENLSKRKETKKKTEEKKKKAKEEAEKKAKEKEKKKEEEKKDKTEEEVKEEKKTKEKEKIKILEKKTAKEAVER